ncbi:hypothetical protein CYMTET_41611 [Cymbomonas tetramitiformis]|uniref:Uncharacterized protein n=1 Tax=Cymbomonas tetramitiformis TaxID=36881 RepID=A0AAE0F1U1_9CHLO|nr:hypothetical protein CYMTET_41611 [Cymbomonas tetramitiformis]
MISQSQDDEWTILRTRSFDFTRFGPLTDESTAAADLWNLVKDDLQLPNALEPVLYTGATTDASRIFLASLLRLDKPLAYIRQSHHPEPLVKQAPERMKNYVDGRHATQTLAKVDEISLFRRVTVVASKNRHYKTSKVKKMRLSSGASSSGSSLGDALGVPGAPVPCEPMESDFSKCTPQFPDIPSVLAPAVITTCAPQNLAPITSNLPQPAAPAFAAPVAPTFLAHAVLAPQQPAAPTVLAPANPVPQQPSAPAFAAPVAPAQQPAASTVLAPAASAPAIAPQQQSAAPTVLAPAVSAPIVPQQPAAPTVVVPTNPNPQPTAAPSFAAPIAP